MCFRTFAIYAHDASAHGMVNSPWFAQVSPGGKEKVDAGAETLQPVQGVYALGDCCSPVETPLPALAQVTRVICAT